MSILVSVARAGTRTASLLCVADPGCDRAFCETDIDYSDPARVKSRIERTYAPVRVGASEANPHATVLVIPHLPCNGDHELEEELLADATVWELAGHKQARVDWSV